MAYNMLYNTTIVYHVEYILYFKLYYIITAARSSTSTANILYKFPVNTHLWDWPSASFLNFLEFRYFDANIL